MKLWHIRWTALLKLKLYDIIIAEMDKLKFSDMQDLIFENYKDVFPDRHGQMISFDCLFLMCRIPSLKGNYHESIHKVYKLLYPQKPWDYRPTAEQHRKLTFFVVNLLTKLPDYPMATKLLFSILKYQDKDMEIWSTLGRLQLQQGDIDGAIRSFIKVLEILIQVESLLGLCSSDESTFVNLPTTFARPDLVLSQRGFVLFAQDKYVEALQYFTELLTLLPDNPSVMNNVAVCHLYSGNVGQAASFLESFMVGHPKEGSNYPELLFNLASMYDLTDSSLSKKRSLLKTILHGCGDDFDPDCLKL
jgi:tetratricopeptide (TPR) repeat protein